MLRAQTSIWLEQKKNSKNINDFNMVKHGQIKVVPIIEVFSREFKNLSYHIELSININCRKGRRDSLKTGLSLVETKCAAEEETAMCVTFRGVEERGWNGRQVRWQWIPLCFSIIFQQSQYDHILLQKIHRFEQMTWHLGPVRKILQPFRPR